MARDVRRKLQSERMAHCGRHESTTHITLEENPSSDERFRIIAPEQKISPSHSRSCVHFRGAGTCAQIFSPRSFGLFARPIARSPMAARNGNDGSGVRSW
jgi:hypothetical protein